MTSMRVLTVLLLPNAAPLAAFFAALSSFVCLLKAFANLVAMPVAPPPEEDDLVGTAGGGASGSSPGRMLVAGKDVVASRLVMGCAPAYDEVLFWCGS